MRASHGRGALGVTVAVVCFAYLDSAVAQQRPVQDTPTPAQVLASVPGVQVFVGAEGGYDTNLDNRVARQGSHYEMLQAGLSGTYKPSDAESYTLYARGRRYFYDQLDADDRYDVDVALGARYDLTRETTLKLGTSWIRDAIPLNRVDIFKSFADLVNETDFYRFRLKLDSRTEAAFGGDQQGTLDPDVFSVSRNKAFDFTKNGGTASILLGRKQFLAPFVISNYTNIEYFNQDPHPAIDRNANEAWVVPGVRLTFSPAFYVDLGARVNRRDFEDKVFNRFTSSFFDGRFTWKMTDTLTLNGIIERQIKEPTTSFGLADDVKTYELELNYKSGPTTVYARAFLDEVRPIGDDFNFKKYNWSAGMIQEIAKTTDLYADYSGKYVKDEVTGDSYNRHRFGAGVRFKF
jgi:Putative beta-barrel porin 2